jgi:lysozyme family protein
MQIRELLIEYNLSNESASADRSAATRRIQKYLNKTYDANLDIDGILGPLTLKSINKFMPKAPKGLADEPNKTTAVQGKNSKGLVK